jgi:hypothetical protein
VAITKNELCYLPYVVSLVVIALVVSIAFVSIDTDATPAPLTKLGSIIGVSICGKDGPCEYESDNVIIGM